MSRHGETETERAARLLRESRDWTPVRRGNLYCSPRCGHGCTWEAHEDARRKAIALEATLGPGWEGRVWEMLGWHYSAHLRANDENFQIHVARSTTGRTTYFLTGPTPLLPSRASYRSPRLAVRSLAKHLAGIARDVGALAKKVARSAEPGRGSRRRRSIA